MEENAILQNRIFEVSASFSPIQGTSEQALYRLLRLFSKSQSALIPLLLLFKQQTLRWFTAWWDGSLDWCIFFVNIVQKRCNLNGLRRFFFLKINEGYTEIGESKTWLCHDWHQIIVSNHFSCFPLFGTTLAPRHSTAYLQPWFDMRDVSALKSSGDCWSCKMIGRQSRQFARSRQKKGWLRHTIFRLCTRQVLCEW